MTKQGRRALLIRLFTMDGKPYIMSYQYRKTGKGYTYKTDLPVLKEMMKEGLVVQIEKTASKVYFKYLGE
jgi:hypothetical protein